MSILMLSLDKNILDRDSASAKRMLSYGLQKRLFILVPDYQKRTVELGNSVVVHSTGGNKFLQFFRMKKIGRRVMRENNIELITTQDPFFTGLIGVCFKRRFKKVLEVQCHGDFFGGNYYKAGGFKSFLQYLIARFLVIRHADKLRVVGERIRQSLLKLGVAESKIEVRPIATDLEMIRNYQPKINLHDKYPGYKKIFLNIGRLDRVKNLDFLISVFAEIVKTKPKYLLLVVGKGKERLRLEEKVRKLSLDANIKFENWTEDPLSCIKTADCVLFPSLSEGYGLVAIEASAAGTPLIMSDVGVANFELKSSDKVKVLQLDKNIWVKEILEF